MNETEANLQYADEFAQNVVNAWGQNMRAGNGPLLSEDFKVLLDKACNYRQAKQLADNHREFGMLSAKDAQEETDTRLELVQAYIAFHKRHRAA